MSEQEGWSDVEPTKGGVFDGPVLSEVSNRRDGRRSRRLAPDADLTYRPRGRLAFANPGAPSNTESPLFAV
jgi:hypothetical protein